MFLSGQLLVLLSLLHKEKLPQGKWLPAHLQGRASRSSAREHHGGTRTADQTPGAMLNPAPAPDCQLTRTALHSGFGWGQQFLIDTRQSERHLWREGVFMRAEPALSDC